MIVLDGIIFGMQRARGVSIYFRELSSRVIASRSDALLWDFGDSGVDGRQVVHRTPRVLEQLRAPRDVPAGSVFHSSYYRVAESLETRNVVTVYDFVYERFLGRAR